MVLTTVSSSDNNIKLSASSQNYDEGMLSARMLSTLPEAFSSVPVTVAVLAKVRF